MPPIDTELPESLAETMTAIFAEGGTLAQKLPGYESRPSQLKMAGAIARLLEAEHPSADQGGLLMVEAGTGTGKTLAYLVPAILSGQKVVVSTNTLTLQDQILNKEIPFIREHLAPQLNAICVKGRHNYLCLYRWQQQAASPQRSLLAGDREMEQLGHWLNETETGDRAELPWLSDQSPLWQAVSATSSQCLGSQCPDAGPCFISRLRKKAAQAHLLIVNHHLFFSDLALRRFGHAEVLPRYESVIFDEAHHLENVATRYFGSSFSQYQLIDLVRDLETAAAAELTGREQEALIQTARALLKQADCFAEIFPPERGRFALLPFIERFADWEQERQKLLDHLTALSDRLANVSINLESWQGFERRARELQGAFVAITKAQRPSEVYWYERRERTLALSASPIDIAEQMQDFLYGQIRNAVFTSATLAIGKSGAEGGPESCGNGAFDYFCGRLGLPDETPALILPTSFDYPNRTRLFVPDRGFPEPSDRNFPVRFQELVREIVLAAGGRTLLLFTSYRAMLATHQALQDSLPFPLLVQGEAPRATLLEQFRARTDSVLFAVSSFWEGVDVPGRSLGCVIIDKLPFEVPSDPVMMARMERIKNQGGNPFYDFQVPRAILSLRQGVGRLMRSADDHGVLAICDVRLFSKQYGKLFLKSLPESPICRDPSEIRAFFDKETCR